MTRYWIGVASADHARAGAAQGFAQLGHGKHAPVKRLSPGDGIVYYAPKSSLTDGVPVQAFVSIGRVTSEAYQASQNPDFMPWRRDVAYFEAHEAPIRPLLDSLSFSAGGQNWGMVMRRGLVEITAEDFRLIARAMGAEDQARSL